MRLAFESMNSVKQIALPNVDLNRTKVEKGRIQPFLRPHCGAGTSHLINPHPGIGFILWAPLALRPWTQTQTELQHQLSWISSLQMADPGTSKLPKLS